MASRRSILNPGISLGDAELIFDFMANEELYEPDLTEVKKELYGKESSNRVLKAVVKPKITKEKLINKYSLISDSIKKVKDTVIDNSLILDECDDFDFSFESTDVSKDTPDTNDNSEKFISETSEKPKISNSKENKLFTEDTEDTDYSFEDADDNEEESEYSFESDEDTDDEDGYSFDGDNDEDDEDDYSFDNDEDDDDEDDESYGFEDGLFEEDEDSSYEFDLDSEEDEESEQDVVTSHKEEAIKNDNNTSIKKEEHCNIVEIDDKDKAKTSDIEDESYEFDEEEDEYSFESDEDGLFEEDEDTESDEGEQYSFELDDDEEEDNSPFEDNEDSLFEEDEESYIFEDIDETDEVETSEQTIKTVENNKQAEIVENKSNSNIKETSEKKVKAEEVIKEESLLDDRLKREREENELLREKIRLLEKQKTLEAELNSTKATNNALNSSEEKDKILDNDTVSINKSSKNIDKLDTIDELLNKPKAKKDDTPNYDRYTVMTTEELYKNVKHYMIKLGVKNKEISLDMLNNKFGSNNIKGLIVKQYLIKTKKGVTVGR